MRNLFWVFILTSSLALAQAPETPKQPGLAEGPTEAPKKLGFADEYSIPLKTLSPGAKALLKQMDVLKSQERAAVASDSGRAAVALIEQERLLAALSSEEPKDGKAIEKLEQAVQKNVALLRRDFNLDNAELRDEFMKAIVLDEEKRDFELQKFVRNSRIGAFAAYSEEIALSLLSLRKEDPAPAEKEPAPRTVFPWNDELNEQFAQPRKAALLEKVSAETGLKNVAAKLAIPSTAEKSEAFKKYVHSILEALEISDLPRHTVGEIEYAKEYTKPAFRRLKLEELEWIEKVGVFTVASVTEALKTFDTLIEMERFRLSLNASPVAAPAELSEKISKWVTAGVATFEKRFGLIDPNTRERFVKMCQLQGEARSASLKEFVYEGRKPYATSSAEYAFAILQLADVDPGEIHRALKSAIALKPSGEEMKKSLSPELQASLLEKTSAATALESLRAQIEALAKK